MTQLADLIEACHHFADGPEADSCAAANTGPFDHVVSGATPEYWNDLAHHIHVTGHPETAAVTHAVAQHLHNKRVGLG